MMHPFVWAARLCALLSLFLIAAPLAAQDRVYVIYDSSNSMWGALPDKTRKYEAARAALTTLVTDGSGMRDIALRMYGHRRKDDCSDSELVVPFGDQAENRDAIVAAMSAVRPTGRTPIDRSLRAALADFGGKSGAIILISDGIESCDADPCALVRSWKDKDIAISVHVVGLGLRGKERAAMECIAQAAGTQYRDAFSSRELAESLEQAVASGRIAPGQPDPAPQATGPDLALVIRTPDGAAQAGHGVLRPLAGGAPIPIKTFARHTPPPGEYVFTGGITVLGGAIHAPQTRPVTVAPAGRIEIALTAPPPPTVSATFAMKDAEIRETVVIAYRGGEKLGAFRGDEAAFVPEGSLEFRSKLAGTSQELSVTETFAAGDHKIIAFRAETEVNLRVTLLFSNGTRLLAKPAIKLFQDGVEVDKLNRASGGLVRPGTYILRADDGLNQFEQMLVVTAEPNQEIVLDVPSGAVTVTYEDATGARHPPARIFIRRVDMRRAKLRQSDQSIGLTPGTYEITGHPKAAGYPPTELTITDGSTQSLVLRATR